MDWWLIGLFVFLFTFTFSLGYNLDKVERWLTHRRRVPLDSTPWTDPPLKLDKRRTRYMPPELVAEIEYLHADEHRTRNSVREVKDGHTAWDLLAGYRDPAGPIQCDDDWHQLQFPSAACQSCVRRMESR